MRDWLYLWTDCFWTMILGHDFHILLFLLLLLLLLLFRLCCCFGFAILLLLYFSYFWYYYYHYYYYYYYHHYYYYYWLLNLFLFFVAMLGYFLLSYLAVLLFMFVTSWHKFTNLCYFLLLLCLGYYVFDYQYFNL